MPKTVNERCELVKLCDVNCTSVALPVIVSLWAPSCVMLSYLAFTTNTRFGLREC